MYLTNKTDVANHPIKSNILKLNYQKILLFVKNGTIGIFTLFASIVLIKVLFVLVNL